MRSRIWGAALALLLMSLLLAACGAPPLPQHWPGLTVAGGTVYAISGVPQRVYMLDAETGVSKGTFVPQGEHRGVVYWSPVAVGEDLAFVGFSAQQDQFFSLFAFDPDTGQQMWNVEADDLILAAPVYAEGTVYFGTSGGSVYAIDPTTRLIKPGWPFQAEEAIWASPLVADGRVYVPSMDHRLYCLDAETGQVVWDFEARGALAAQPARSNGVLYQPALDARLYALQADSGEVVSGFDFRAGNWIWSEPLAEPDRLFVTSLDGNLYALDPATGQVLPPFPYSAGSSDLIRAAPVKAGALVIVAANSGRITALNGETGQMQWQWPSGTPSASILTTPIVDGDRLYVILTNGQVFALETATGLQLPGWPFTPPTQQ